LSANKNHHESATKGDAGQQEEFYLISFKLLHYELCYAGTLETVFIVNFIANISITSF